MNKEILSQLRAIHLPPPVSMWPSAIGWEIMYLLIGLILLGVIYFLMFHFKMWRIKREALRQLKELQDEWQATSGTSQVMCQLSILLRRVALVIYPREKVAGLSGSAWIEFLNQCVNQPLFTKEISQLLLVAPYQLSFEISNKDVFIAAQNWIKLVLKKS